MDRMAEGEDDDHSVFVIDLNGPHPLEKNADRSFILIVEGRFP